MAISPPLDRALEAILDRPGSIIVVSLGFDTYGRDPIGDFALTTPVYHEVGRRVAATGRRLVILQEGGYYRPALGDNAVAWLRGAEGPLTAITGVPSRLVAEIVTDVPSPTDLPANVRRLVDEIENEIGETDLAADDIAGEVLAGRRRGQRQGRSRRSARSSSRSATIRIGRASSGRPSGSTGCTRS